MILYIKQLTPNKYAKNSRQKKKYVLVVFSKEKKITGKRLALLALTHGAFMKSLMTAFLYMLINKHIFTMRRVQVSSLV